MDDPSNPLPTLALSSGSQAALREAGWHESRDKISIEHEYSRLMGAKWLPAAGPFLRRFGGLFISHSLLIWEDPVADDAFTRLEPKIADIVQSNVVPVATSNYLGEGCVIWIDQQGRFYAADLEGMAFLGDREEQVLEVLLFGAPPSAPPPELRDRLKSACEWYKH